MKFFVLILTTFLLGACAHHGGEGHGHHGHQGCKKNGCKAKKFKMMDENGDGKVSKAEFAEAGKAKFARKDTNGDGFLTAEDGEGYKCNKCR